MGKRLNTKGFTAVEVLLVFIFIAIVGFAGYYVWHSQKSDKKVSTTASSSQSSSKQPTAAPTTHSTDEVVAATQKAYDTYITAVTQALNNASSSQPAVQTALAAIKPNLTGDLYNKLNATYTAGPPQDLVLCTSFGADSVKVHLDSSDAKTTKVTVEKFFEGNSTGTIPVTVDRGSLLISSITCPSS